MTVSRSSQMAAMGAIGAGYDRQLLAVFCPSPPAEIDPKRTVAKGRNLPKALPRSARIRPGLLRTLFSQRPGLLVVER